MNLLFILSLPRSGSTLLARMLLTHPRITSARHAEPHLFVSALGPLTNLQTLATYGAAFSKASALDYLDTTAIGRDGYKARVSALIEQIYLSSSTDDGADWFIEKTTRNSLIAEELIKALPRARFLILWRNPLDVIASVYRTWCGDRWTWNANSVELLTGLEKLIEIQHRDTERTLTLQYEDLVAHPLSTLARISTFLGIESDYSAGQKNLSQVEFSGPHDPYARELSNQTAHKQSVEKWRKSIITRRRRRMARRYIDWIGRERLCLMGYDQGQLHKQLDVLDLPLVASLAEDLRMEALMLKRILSISSWHIMNESRAFSRGALR